MLHLLVKKEYFLFPPANLDINGDLYAPAIGKTIIYFRIPEKGTKVFKAFMNASFILLRIDAPDGRRFPLTAD